MSEGKWERFRRETNIDLKAELAAGGGDGSLENYYTKDETNGLLGTKTDTSTTAEIESRVEALETNPPTTDLTNYYTKTQVDSSLATKANTSHTHDDRYFTEAETNSLLSGKADAGIVTSHLNDTDNPHSVTKAQVGLANVDNTSDLAKPVSTATQTALNAKADTGHTHDSRYYTETETDSLLAGKANASDLTAHTSNTSNPHGVTKAQVGLSNVDNTSDANKPISTAMQTALNGKSDTTHNHDSRYRNLVTTQAELITAVAAGGDIVVDSRVTIALTQQINITTPCKIIGGKFTRTSGCAFYVTASDVEFRGVKITGGGGSTYDSTQKLIYAVGTSTTLLKNIRVINCELLSSRGDNVWLEWCMDSAVENNYIATFLYSGVMLISSRRCLVSGNVIRDAPLTSGVVNVYGIAATDLLNSDAARSRDITIVGNQISLIDWEGIDTHGGSGINITGNTVTACPRGIALVVGNETRVIAPVRCVVSGNLVDGAGVRQTIREGIVLTGIAGVSADGTIVGNHVTNHSPTFSNTYVARDKFYVGQNNELYVPWTNITMGAGFTANPTYPPQYSIDGNTVYLRGGVIPKAGGVAGNTAIGTIDSAFGWPTQLTFICFVRGSNTAAGSGYVAVDTSGNLQMLYGSGTDSYTYFLNGSYQAA